MILAADPAPSCTLTPPNPGCLARPAMPETFHGQCQCGAVRYRVTGTSATLFACHCTDCQRQSASAFGMALWVRDAAVALTGGEPKEWLRTMPSLAMKRLVPSGRGLHGAGALVFYTGPAGSRL